MVIVHVFYKYNNVDSFAFANVDVSQPVDDVQAFRNRKILGTTTEDSS